MRPEAWPSRVPVGKHDAGYRPAPPGPGDRRRAKIVCTLGPASADLERITQLVQAGMDIARLNFSHGDRSDHERMYRAVRQAASDAGRTVGILADLQGPKIRLGRFAAGPVEWRPGDEVRITVDDVIGAHDRVSTTYQGLADDARPGDWLLVDDGRVSLHVVDVTGPDVVGQVVEGGTVSDNKGISAPGMKVSIPRADRQGHRRSGVRAGLGGRPGRLVVRPLARRR
jgi:pyruvate kinase